jgi:hypothetical protein
LSGVAVDTSGAVLPGADVTVTMPSTGFTESAVTNADGAFSFPGLNIGTYTVTIKLSGFKTFVSNNVVLTSGAGAAVRATLEIGGLEEQVIVSSASEIIQTQSTTISSTINTNQILKLPLTTRSAMDFVTFLPGVQTPGGNRQSMINGLPQGMINITLDGVNIQDNTLRSTDGFFAIVSPRLDAIEEVTVTTAAQGSESAKGAAQIKFVTRHAHGRRVRAHRRDALNANTCQHRTACEGALKQDQFGGRLGAVVIPDCWTVGTRRSSSSTTRNCAAERRDEKTAQRRRRSRHLSLHVPGQSTCSSWRRPTVSSTIDPRPASCGIRTPPPAARLSATHALLQRPVESKRRFPTVRIDYNLSDKHRQCLELQLVHRRALNGRDTVPRVPRRPASRRCAGAGATRCAPPWDVTW